MHSSCRIVVGVFGFELEIMIGAAGRPGGSVVVHGRLGTDTPSQVALRFESNALAA
jgi:hypothetical protein